MARPRSEERRLAVLEAAVRVISSRGLAAAATAAIAREAGVSNGTLFVYFENKAALLNELYLLLKAEMGEAAFRGASDERDDRAQLHQMWTQWLAWALENPRKRRALAQLEVSDEVTARTRDVVHGSQRAMAALVERCRTGGPLAHLSLSYVLTLTSALADATMDSLIREPADAEERSEAAFDAVWRVIAG